MTDLTAENHYLRGLLLAQTTLFKELVEMLPDDFQALPEIQHLQDLHSRVLAYLHEQQTQNRNQKP